mmetsp:Transcript_163177/g.523337  ORF Transcript_163177/g.523337 Transcript_163177/m.523337 type:complete len:808 (-) Transcript_163177:43-2466(-)
MSPPALRAAGRFDGRAEGAAKRFQRGVVRASLTELASDKIGTGKKQEVDEEVGYLESVQDDIGFVKLCLKHQQDFRVPEQSAVDFGLKVSKICWTIGKRILTSDGPLAAAQAELQKLKKRLAKCNLQATRDLEAVKLKAQKNLEAARTPPDKGPGLTRTATVTSSKWVKGIGGEVDGSRSAAVAVAEVQTQQQEQDLDAVTFHEPLQFLDEVTRNLVLAIVCQKMRLLQIGKCPPSLLEALLKSAVEGSEGLLGGGRGRAGAGVGGAAGGSAEDLQDLKVEVKELEFEVQDLHGKLEVSEQKASEARAAARLAREQLREAEAALRRLAEMEVGLRDREAHLDAENARLKQEVEERKEEARDAALRAELSEKRIQELEMPPPLGPCSDDASDSGSEAPNERPEPPEPEPEDSPARRPTKQVLPQTLFQDARGLLSTPLLFTAFEAAASRTSWKQDKAQADLERKSRTRGVEVQTNLTGPQLDEKVAENKKLRVMLEELQLKLKELITRCHTNGVGAVVEVIAANLGLGEVLKRRNVFERLYKDAMDRIVRLEELRERVDRERTELKGYAPEAFAAVQDFIPETPLEPSVLDMVEQSPLRGLAKLATMARPAEAPSRAEVPLEPSRPRAPFRPPEAPSRHRPPEAPSGPLEVSTRHLGSPARGEGSTKGTPMSSRSPSGPPSRAASPAASASKAQAPLTLLQSRPLVASRASSAAGVGERGGGERPPREEGVPRGPRGHPLPWKDPDLEEVARDGVLAPSKGAKRQKGGRPPLGTSTSLPALPPAKAGRAVGAEVVAAAAAAARAAGRA